MLMVIAERAHDKTREMWRHRIDDRSLYERIRAAAGLSDRGLSAALKRLRHVGFNVYQAARQVGVSAETGRRYEAELRRESDW